jgi:hypothetical protein
MHSSRELRSSSFEIEVAGRRAGVEDLFEGFDEHDRLGVVMSRPCGAVGASALITATITAFYDNQRSRSDDFFIYPDYYLFHVGRPLGDHGQLDVWPAHKEVVVPDEAARILEAVNDRAITRLVVEDGEPGEPDLDREALASARARIVTCLAYSHTGRVADADVRIEGNPVTEGYVRAILEPDAHVAELRAEAAGNRAPAPAAGASRADPLATEIAAVGARAGEVPSDVRAGILRDRGALLEGGVPVETYRRISLDEALARLG